MTDLLSTLEARGFLQDATPGLFERLGAGPITAYIGFDPTAASLHVGSLVPVMGLAWLQRFGHTPIALVGGQATGITGGRYMRYAKGTPLANLHVTLLDKLGVHVEKFGDATGRVGNLGDGVLSSI